MAALASSNPEMFTYDLSLANTNDDSNDASNDAEIATETLYLPLAHRLSLRNVHQGVSD